MRRDFAVKAQGFQVVHVADVLADEGLVPPRYTQGVLELRPHGQHARTVAFQKHGARSEAARAAQELRLAGGRVDPRHRVVGADQDVAVVQQEHVGDGGQAAQRLAVAEADGLAARVAGGHHQRGRTPFRQQRAVQAQQHVVQGRVGQHHPHEGGVGRDKRGDGRRGLARFCNTVGFHTIGRSGQSAHQTFCQSARPPASQTGQRAAQHYGPFAPGQQGFFFRGNVHDAPGRGQVRHHDGQRLVRPVLAAAQFAHGGVAGRVASQVKPAQPLHGGDASVGQGAGQGLDGRGARGAARVPCCIGVRFGRGAQRRAVHVPHARPAHRAGVGLGVKAPVQRVFVLRRAFRTQRKAGHGGLVAVVGDEPGDGVARPAVGAVGEGVKVAAVGRVVHVGQAVVAGGHVGADEHLVPGPSFSTVAAGHYAESLLVSHHGDVLVRARDHPRQRGQLVGQVVPEGGDRFRRPLHLYEHPGGGVADRAGQRMVGGDAVDEGAEPHPLDLAGNGELAARENVWHAATIAEDPVGEKTCGGMDRQARKDRNDREHRACRPGRTGSVR